MDAWWQVILDLPWPLVLNVVGLGCDMYGAWLLFKFGVEPFEVMLVGNEEITVMIGKYKRFKKREDAMRWEEEQRMKAPIYKRNARTGFRFLLLVFTIQMVSSVWQAVYF